jgi:hypothetical protein
MDREDGMGKSEIGRARYDTIANEISLFMEPGVFFWGVGSAYKIKKKQVLGFYLQSRQLGN